MSMVLPGVVGFKLTGKLGPGVTATDLVLTVTQILRKHGVVGKFVEFYGEFTWSLRSHLSSSVLLTANLRTSEDPHLVAHVPFSDNELITICRGWHGEPVPCRSRDNCQYVS